MKIRALIPLFLILSLAFCIALTSCGGTDGETNGTSSTSGTSNHEHIYGEWEIVKEPSCTEVGRRQKKCTCSDAIFEEIRWTGHSYKDGVCQDCGELVPSEGLEYSLLSDGTGYMLKGMGTCTDKDVRIASIYNGLPVREIKELAFRECTEMVTVTIPNTVRRVGERAFEYCDGLQFNEYENALYLGNKDNPYLFLYKEKSRDISTCVINERTRFIDGAFRKCNSLTSVVIPNGVISIGYKAFSGCEALQSVVLPNTLELIESGAFAECEALNSINIPDSLVCMREYPFRESTGVIEVENGVSYVGNWVIRCDRSVTAVSLRENTAGICDVAFGFCEDMQSITMPDTVKYIGEAAFCNCESLKSIVIPEGVTALGFRMFKKCSALASITIPKSVTEIGGSAFDGCGSLESIVLSKEIRIVGENAFDGCDKLTIYCEAQEKPSGWSENWSSTECVVEWGYITEN